MELTGELYLRLNKIINFNPADERDEFSVTNFHAVMEELLKMRAVIPELEVEIMSLELVIDISEEHPEIVMEWIEADLKEDLDVDTAIRKRNLKDLKRILLREKRFLKELEEQLPDFKHKMFLLN